MTFGQFMSYTHTVLRGSEEEKARYLFKFISGNKKWFYFRDLVDFYKTMTQNDIPGDLVKSKTYEDREETDWVTMAKLTWAVMGKSESATANLGNPPTALTEVAQRIRSDKIISSDQALGARQGSTLNDMFFGSELANRITSQNEFEIQTELPKADSPNIQNYPPSSLNLAPSGSSPAQQNYAANTPSVSIPVPPESRDSYVIFDEFIQFLSKSPLNKELFSFFHDKSKNLLLSVQQGRPYFEMLTRLDNLELLLENLEFIIISNNKTVNLNNPQRFTTKFYNAFIKMLNEQKVQQLKDPRVTSQVRRTLDAVTLLNRGSISIARTSSEKQNLLAQMQVIHLLNRGAEKLNEMTLKSGFVLPSAVTANNTTSTNVKGEDDFSILPEDVDDELNLPNPTLRPDDPNRDLAYLSVNMFKSVRVRIANLRALVKAQIDKLMDDRYVSRAMLTQRNYQSQNNTKQNKREVFVNNKNWNIVTSMINGIQKSILMSSTDRDRTLTKMDFKMHNKLEMEAVFSNGFDRVKFKDYSPKVFLSIRRMFGLSNEEYIRSLGVDTFGNTFFNRLMVMLSEHSSGKSGSILFHTADGKYLVKSIHKKEFELLRLILKEYYKYLQKEPQTLMTRYFGLHQIKCYSGIELVSEVFVVVMNNVFDLANPDKIQNKFDLKGSTYGRLTSPEEVMQKGAAKKDNNFLEENGTMKLPKVIYERLTAQIEKDSAFLADNGIIDYSLLIGSIEASGDPNVRPMFQVGEALFSSKEGRRQSFVESHDGTMHYYVGIIDTLTAFDLRKKGEFAVKRLFQGKGISCLPPKDYKKRFDNFVHDRVFQPYDEYRLFH